MSRNGSGVYSLPAGSLITNGEASDATDLNTPFEDLEADANTARPIVAGGTGATTAAEALTNLRVGVEVISRTVLGSATTGVTVTWDNALYDTIEIHAQNIVPSTDGAFILMRTSADGGASFDTGATDYGWRRAERDLGVTESPVTDGDTSGQIDLTGQVGNDTNEGGASLVITLQNAGLLKHTKINWTGSYHTGSASIETGVQGWARRGIAEVVDGARILVGSGNIQSGAIFTVYGYRK